MLPRDHYPPLVLRPRVARQGVRLRIGCMTEEAWQAAWNLYDAACNLPGGERACYVETSASSPEQASMVSTCFGEWTPRSRLFFPPLPLSPMARTRNGRTWARPSDGLPWSLPWGAAAWARYTARATWN